MAQQQQQQQQQQASNNSNNLILQLQSQPVPSLLKLSMTV
jgi:hypothetical protein